MSWLVSSHRVRPIEPQEQAERSRFRTRAPGSPQNEGSLAQPLLPRIQVLTVFFPRTPRGGSALTPHDSEGAAACSGAGGVKPTTCGTWPRDPPSPLPEVVTFAVSSALATWFDDPHPAGESLTPRFNLVCWFC